MPPDPFECALRSLHRALEGHHHLLGRELDRVRREMESTMDRARRLVEDEQAGFIAMMEEARRRMGRSDWSDPDKWTTPRKRRRRPPRKPRGTEPAPVKPRPKPTPLMDGAEAPIE